MKPYSQWACELAVKAGVNPEAIDFIYQTLQFVPNYRGEEPSGGEFPTQHSNVQDFCHAFVSLAKDTYGVEYTYTLEQWNLNTSEKLGDAVFKLIDCGALTHSDDECRADFDGLFDLTQTKPPK